MTEYTCSCMVTKRELFSPDYQAPCGKPATTVENGYLYCDECMPSGFKDRIRTRKREKKILDLTQAARIVKDLEPDLSDRLHQFIDLYLEIE